MRSNSTQYQHPEASYIMKYDPKYYKNLTLEIRPFTPLLSKIKKIKKLKTFTALSIGHFPQTLLLNLFANDRKEIEEIPQVSPKKFSKYHWVTYSERMMRYFPNMKRIFPARLESDYLTGNFGPLLSLEEFFEHHLWNMRRLKSLKILIKDENYHEVKCALAKLDQMSRLLDQLETLIIKVKTTNQNDFQELFQYKNVFSHLTGLDLPGGLDPLFVGMSQKCKNLMSLSLNMKNSKDKKPEIFNLLTSIQELAGLKSLEFSWPEDAKLFWGDFKPQPSLRYLTLKFNAFDLLNENNKDIARHWGEIKELEILELKILCGPVREIMLVRLLITKILKKVGKLSQLKVFLEGSFDPLGFQTCYEPFVAEEIPHLYESLQRFEYYLQDLSTGQDIKVDLKMTKLKLLKNLREVKLDGNGVCFENMDKIVDFLQENQSYPMLEINVESRAQPRWLGDTLQRIQKIKRTDRNLKIAINLTFRTNTPYALGMKSNRLAQIFGELWENIQTVKTIKGLRICLSLHDESLFSSFPVEGVKKILEKYPGLRNVNFCLSYTLGSIEYVSMDGEKTQLIVDKFY